MKQHKWAKEIKAWADGAEIEKNYCGSWITMSTPAWKINDEYRIKPQPKEPKYLYVYKPDYRSIVISDNELPHKILGKIKLETEE